MSIRNPASEPYYELVALVEFDGVPTSNATLYVKKCTFPVAPTQLTWNGSPGNYLLTLPSSGIGNDIQMAWTPPIQPPNIDFATPLPFIIPGVIAGTHTVQYLAYYNDSGIWGNADPGTGPDALWFLTVRKYFA